MSESLDFKNETWKASASPENWEAHLWQANELHKFAKLFRWKQFSHFMEDYLCYRIIWSSNFSRFKTWDYMVEIGSNLLLCRAYENQAKVWHLCAWNSNLFHLSSVLEEWALTKLLKIVFSIALL